MKQTNLVEVNLIKTNSILNKTDHANPGGALPINGLMGMCRWMGSHFHDRTDYNGAAFSSTFYRVTRMGSHFSGILRVRKF